MHSITRPFEQLEIARAWPVFVTCSGEVEVEIADDEWSIGDVTVNWFRGGELVETVTYTGCHPRAERIRNLIIHDAHRCAVINDAITADAESRATLAQEAQYDERRDAA